MRAKFRALSSNEFIRHNAIFWVASLGVSFLNYLYYPVLGRLLDPTNFGETQTIISFMTQTGIFLQVLALVSVTIITKYQDKSEREAVSNELSRLTLLLSAILLISTIVFSPLLRDFFHFSSVTPFLVLAVFLFVSVPASLATAFLQGHKKFGTLATSSLGGAVAKIVFSVIFVLLGFKTVGAIGGLVASQILTLLYALQKGNGVRHFVASNLHFRRPKWALLKPELPFTAMVFATSLTTNLLLSFDILVVKHYFPPAQAGFYTGISIISNIIFFLSGPFASVLIPSLQPHGLASDNQAFLKRTLTLTALAGGCVLLVFLVAPHLVVLILLGAKYAHYAPYLRGLGVSIYALSLANVLIIYHIGLRHFWVAPTVLVGFITTVVLLARFHATIGAVVSDLVTGAVVLLVALIGLTVKYRMHIIGHDRTSAA